MRQHALSDVSRRERQKFANQLIAAFPEGRGVADAAKLAELGKAVNTLRDPEARTLAQQMVDRFAFDEGEHDAGVEAEAQRRDLAAFLGVKPADLPAPATCWLERAVPNANVVVTHFEDALDLRGDGPLFGMQRKVDLAEPWPGGGPLILEASQDRLSMVSVKADGKPVTFEHRDNRLFLQAPAGTRSLRFDYRVKASEDLNGFGLMRDPKTGDLTTLSWPDRGGMLGPVNSDPEHRVTCVTQVKADPGMTVIGTGLEQDGAHVLEQGVSVYAAGQVVASRRFAVSDWVTAPKSGVRFRWAGLDGEVDPASRTKALEAVVAAADFFFEEHGPSLHPAYTFVEAQGGMGGMEHAGSPIVYLGAAKDPRAIVNTAIHELRHAYDGNGTNIRDWDDFAMSEGPTTYWTARALGEQQGEAQLHALLDALKASGGKALEKGNHALHPPADMDILRAFDRVPYDFGAWMLRMLEAHPDIGTARFDEASRAWYAEKLGREAISVEDYCAFMTQATGVDVQAFFDGWNAVRALPALSSQVAIESGGVEVSLTAHNAIPAGTTLPLRLYGPDGQQTDVRVAPGTSRQFIPCEHRITRAVWDPDRTVFAQVDAPPAPPG